MGNLRRFLGVLRHRDFRLLWLASTASLIGDAIVIVALALFVIEETGSATQLGLVLAAHAIPLVGFLLIGGVWADRLPKHRLMIATDLARFVLHGLLALLILAGHVEIWQIVVIEALFGTAEAFSRPATTALVPQTVPEHKIQEANAVMAMSENVAEFIGPALAAVLVLGVGAGAAFGLDALTFAVSAVLLAGVRPRPRGEPESGEPESALAEMAEGFREVRSRAWVWVTLVVFSVALLLTLAPWYVLGPIVAEEQYGSVSVYGIAAAVYGAGTVIGSLIAIGWRPRYPMRLGMLFLLIWFPPAIFYAAGVTLWLTMPSLVIAGISIALFEVWWVTALAERIPPNRLSRVTSYDWMVSMGLLPIGYLLAGPLADVFGAVDVMIAGAVIALAFSTVGLIPRETRMLESTPGRPPAQSETPASPGVPVP